VFYHTDGRDVMITLKAESEHKLAWVELRAPLVGLCSDQARSWYLILACYVEFLQLTVH